MRLDAFTEDLNTNAPPAIRNLIDEWGDATIIKAKICRIPLHSAIQKIGNILSLGQLQKNKVKLGYNDLFHLYVELALRKPNGQIGVFSIEKNQKAGFKIENGEVGTKKECINQPPTKKVTLLEMFKRAEKAVGSHKLWVYSLESANCQDFAIALLGSGNNMLTSEGRTFAKQSPEKLLPSYLLKITGKVTNLANRIKTFLYGAGVKIPKNMHGGAYLDYLQRKHFMNQ